MRALPPQFEELVDLVWALVSDRLDAAGTSRLRQLLENDADNRRIYIGLMDQFASLEWERAEGEQSYRQHQGQEKAIGSSVHVDASGQGPPEPIKSRAHQGPVQCPSAPCWGGGSSVAPAGNENQHRGICFSACSVTTL